MIKIKSIMMNIYQKLLASFTAAALCLSSFAAAAEEDIPDPFAAMRAGQQQSAPAADPNTPVVIPAAPVFDAQAWVLMDAASGQVLLKHNAHDKIWPASLTKMMTSYVIGMEFKAGRLKPDDEVIITNEAWSKNANYADSSKMFIEIGKSIKVDDLNKGIIIQSGNDACVAMAIHLAGTEQGFVSVMNTYAQRLGLNDTNFSNVHGLFDEYNYSSAYDMSLLGRALIRDLPDEYKIYAQKEFTFNGIKQLNRNRLLWDKTLAVDGIKTGHLSQVGYNLTASAVQGGMRLIATVIGAKSEADRADFCKQMLNYGFRFFENYSPFAPDQTILQREVRMGDTDSIDLVVKEPVNLMIPKGSAGRVKVSYRLGSAIFLAPIEQGQSLGVIEFKLDDRLLAQYPLIAKDAVGEGGIISRLWDKVYMFFASED